MNLKYDKEQVEKIALYVIVGAAFVAGSWFGFFSPGFHKLSGLKKKCSELTDKIDDAKDKIRNREKLTARCDNYEKRMKELEKFIPMESDTSWILRTVAEIEAGLKFKTERIVPYAEAQQPGTAPAPENPLFTFKYAQINLKAGYHQIGEFINTLEKKIRFLKIISLSIDGDKDSPLQHNVEIKVKYLVLKQPLTE